MARNPKDYAKFKKDRCVIGDDCFGPLDPDHVKTLASGGKNVAQNIMTLCRAHHVEKGQKGIIHMAEKYPQYKKWLLENDWEFDTFRGKWVRYETKDI